VTFIDDVVDMRTKSEVLVEGYSKQFQCLLRLNRAVCQAVFDYEIEHRPGRLHCNADGVSRPACKQCIGKVAKVPWVDELERADELSEPLGIRGITWAPEVTNEELIIYSCACWSPVGPSGPRQNLGTTRTGILMAWYAPRRVIVVPSFPTVCKGTTTPK